MSSMISEEELPLRQDKSYLFKCLLLANFLQYLEAGAVPALLLQLSISFNMGSAKQGLLGGVVYLSLSLGGPFAGYLLRNFEHKTVISCAVAANMFFTLIWALTPVGKSYSTNMFISVRFMMGLCQCVVCAFLPLWTNENAPKKYRTSWMSYLQASVPFGVMTGYIIASILTELSNHRTTCFGLLCWRWSFLIEIILLTPLYLGLYLIPKEDIQVCAVKRPTRTGGNKGSVGTASGCSREIPSATTAATFITSANRRNITNDIEAPIPYKVVKPGAESTTAFDSPSIAAASKRRKHGALTPDERLQCSSLRKTAMSASLYDATAARYAFKKSCDNISLLGAEDSVFPALPGLRRYETEDDLTGTQQQLLPPIEQLSSNSNSKIRANSSTLGKHRRSPHYARLGQSHHTLPEADSLSEEEGQRHSGDQRRGSGEGSYFLGPTVEEDIVVTATSRKSPDKLRKARSRSSDAAIPGSQQARAKQFLHPQTKSTESASPPGYVKHQSLQDWLLGGLSGLSYSTSTARHDRRACSDSQPLLPITAMSAQDTGGADYTVYGSIPKSTGNLHSKRHSFDQRQDPERRYRSSPKLSTAAHQSKKTPEPVEYESFRDLTRKNSIGSSRGKHRSSWGMFSLLGYNNTTGATSRGNSRRNSFNERPFTSITNNTTRRSDPPQPRTLSRTSLTSSPYDLLVDSLTGTEKGLRTNEEVTEDYPVCRRFSAGDLDLEPYLEEDLESPSPVPLKERFRAVSNPARTSSPLLRNVPSRTEFGSETSGKGDRVNVEYSPYPDDEFSEDADCSASEDDISYSPSDSCSEDEWDDLTPPRASRQHGYYSTPPSRVAFTPISTSATSFLGSGGLTMSGGSKRAAATPGSVTASVVAIARASQAAEEEDNRNTLESVARWCRHTFRYLVSVVESVRALLAIKTYRYLLGAMSALYFTVTGVQFWGTKYLTVALHAPLPLVNTLFILCAATGPTLGVFFGGWIVDLNGGYKGAHQRVVALEMCATFGVLACVLSLPITLLSNIFVVVGFLWVVLFFGGAMLPACSGIVVSIIPRAYRPTSSALALMVFNMFGYFMSLLLSGLLMQYLDSHSSEGCNEVCSMTWGFRLILFWSFLSVAFLLLALFAAYQHLKDRDRGHGRSSSVRHRRRPPANSKKLHTDTGSTNSIAIS